MLLRCAEAAGIGSRVRWHIRRHGFAAGLADHGVTITDIRDALGSPLSL
jgi:site-specific recombinase XerD